MIKLKKIWSMFLNYLLNRINQNYKIFIYTLLDWNEKQDDDHISI